jgi:DedD protein
MRDSHRMKEKYDLSLDNRQIGSLLIASIVVLGAVFVLGVVIGKKLATSDRSQGAPDLLSALDQKAEKMEQVTDASLTFQDELTKKTEPVKDDSSAKKPDAEPKKAPPPDPKKPETSDEKALAIAEPVAPAPPEPVVAQPAKLSDADAQPTPTRIATKDAGPGKPDAVARAKPETSPNGPYTLQLSASQSRAEADKFAAHLRDKGYAPFIITADVPGRGTWYRVRMGSFASKDAASRYLQDFKRETQLEAFVAANDETKK